MRSAHFWDFAQRRLVVSWRRFGTTVVGGEILTAVLLKIQVIWDFSPCRLVILPSSSGSTAQDALRSTETSVTLHQSTGLNLHQHLWENVTSHRKRTSRAELLCMTRLLRICEDHCRIHKSLILDLIFIPGIMIY